ncbi:MAG: hypothetical protein WKF58_08375 [Ilumatobacteraceae bacterium]
MPVRPSDLGWGSTSTSPAAHTYDWCYGAKPYGRSEYGRYRRDVDFLNNMRAQCRAQYAQQPDARLLLRGRRDLLITAGAGGWHALELNPLATLAGGSPCLARSR